MVVPPRPLSGHSRSTQGNLSSDIPVQHYWLCSYGSFIAFCLLDALHFNPLTFPGKGFGTEIFNFLFGLSFVLCLNVI
jgi:hypothetical protein